jgi:hypothetical protein
MRTMALPTSRTVDDAGSGTRWAGVVPSPGISCAALSEGTTMLTCSRNRSSCSAVGCGSMLLLPVAPRVAASWKRTPRSKPAPSIDQPRIRSGKPVESTVGSTVPWWKVAPPVVDDVRSTAASPSSVARRNGRLRAGRNRQQVEDAGT